MKILFLADGWADFRYWQANDAKVLTRIAAIYDLRRSPFVRIGKPEPLRNNLTGWWAKRITDAHRLIYRVVDAERPMEIAQCRYHYDG